jgi:hypothetical protein
MTERQPKKERNWLKTILLVGVVALLGIELFDDGLNN